VRGVTGRVSLQVRISNALMESRNQLKENKTIWFEPLKSFYPRINLFLKIHLEKNVINLFCKIPYSRL